MGKCMKSENPVVCLTDCSFHSHSFKHSSTLPPPISHPPCLDFPPVETLHDLCKLIISLFSLQNCATACYSQRFFAIWDHTCSRLTSQICCSPRECPNKRSNSELLCKVSQKKSKHGVKKKKIVPVSSKSLKIRMITLAGVLLLVSKQRNIILFQMRPFLVQSSLESAQVLM